jgi:hypothetical protein
MAFITDDPRRDLLRWQEGLPPSVRGTLSERRPMRGFGWHREILPPSYSVETSRKDFPRRVLLGFRDQDPLTALTMIREIVRTWVALTRGFADNEGTP